MTRYYNIDHSILPKKQCEMKCLEIVSEWAELFSSSVRLSIDLPFKTRNSDVRPVSDENFGLPCLLAIFILPCFAFTITTMLFWSSIVFGMLIAAPLTVSRHIEHNGSKRTARRHEDIKEEQLVFSPKAHLVCPLKGPPKRVLHVKEGESEILECQAGGSPLPHIYWLKNGVQLSKIEIEDELDLKTDDNGERKRLNMGSTSSRLYLDCVTIGDDAEYTCIAENANLRESTTTQVKVSSSDDRGCQSKKQSGQAPRIVSWTKTALENQGQDVQVFCKVEGHPKPTIKWLDPQEEEIDPEKGPKFDILFNGDLLIRNLKWKDMGNYICVAENTQDFGGNIRNPLVELIKMKDYSSNFVFNLHYKHLEFKFIGQLMNY
ncbi:hypothetical protein TNIN_61371 [Trichonephila inaurata madagascariensis]|uniref:Ig-like domain-containing protein n=1 Tax=Trichonephila inaurata madagascariensis TaxID=2747483 RepID=A0A8X6WV39_9ARAC|nr:hypothetical protein TNIN_61371 [Trichonephila inaurata madagascariensis]